MYRIKQCGEVIPNNRTPLPLADDTEPLSWSMIIGILESIINGLPVQDDLAKLEIRKRLGYKVSHC